MPNSEYAAISEMRLITCDYGSDSWLENKPTVRLVKDTTVKTGAVVMHLRTSAKPRQRLADW